MQSDHDMSLFREPEVPGSLRPSKESHHTGPSLVRDFTRKALPSVHSRQHIRVFEAR
jgi:hypothetical protein